VTDPIVGTNNALVTDLQGQSQASGYITVYELELPDSGIGGTGIDKLFFHDGRNGTSDITWYSLLNEDNFGSGTVGHYSQRTYQALPIESEGWEVRGSGTGSLPRPTIRLGNINQFFKAYLAEWDELIGAKIIRRRTLEKYLSTTPPVEFNRDVYYIERKSSETPALIEFELTSAFDVEGIKLPRRNILAARCPWKYKDTEQGGCNWPEDNVYGGNTLYFNKDDTRITLDTTSPGATEYTYWGRQDGRVTNGGGYINQSYSVGDYVEYQRPIGSLYKVKKLEYSSTVTTLTLESASIAGTFSAGEYIIIKGMSTSSANHKNYPLYVEGNSGATITVETDGSHTATIGDGSTDIGYIQVCRKTLYKCITAHSITTSDSIDDLIKPTNISYWEFGDVCGKRLSSCAARFGHVDTGSVDVIHIKMTDGVLQGGSGYTNGTGLSLVTIAAPTGSDPVTATATCDVVGNKVTKFNIVEKGNGYESNPTVTISGGGGSGAVAEARVKYQSTDNVALPFGGFPGASFG